MARNEKNLAGNFSRFSELENALKGPEESLSSKKGSNALFFLSECIHPCTNSNFSLLNFEHQIVILHTKYNLKCG